MDGAASAIAVVSLAIQLADSIKSLLEFWESVKEAPKEIQVITTDLKLLDSVLSSIASDAQHAEPDEILTRALQHCQGTMNTLLFILKDIEPGFAASSLRIRRWTAIKAVWMNGKLNRFQDQLERLKSSLLLVQQTYNG